MSAAAVSLEQRHDDLDCALTNLEAVAAQWSESRAGGRVPAALDEELTTAIQSVRAAESRLRKTVSRLRKRYDT